MKKLILILISLNLFASEVGTLIYKNGIVKIKHSSSIIKKSLKIGDKIETGDKVITYNSLATIKLKDNSIIKLNKFSSIKFGKKFFQTGEVYYHITKQKHKILEVATEFTTIGVKGTIFIVDTNQTKAVSLKKGLISLTSPKGKYEIHRKKLFSEFKNYQKKVNDEFDAYKKQLYKEFIEYKKSFDLSQNHMVSFNGNKVYENNYIPKNKFQFFENKFDNNQSIKTNNSIKVPLKETNKTNETNISNSKTKQQKDEFEDDDFKSINKDDFFKNDSDF